MNFSRYYLGDESSMTSSVLRFLTNMGIFNKESCIHRYVLYYVCMVFYARMYVCIYAVYVCMCICTGALVCMYVCKYYVCVCMYSMHCLYIMYVCMYAQV